ncbi:hypothetical protein [Streptomyces caniscabiei]|uniref:hypothetical protein n=1 Tax=Streptomyces caniscabiei TaxID=2746961 RepID=UPI0015C4EEAF|nr:hypothetical protein [Streptomyces caniscabiei]
MSPPMYPAARTAASPARTATREAPLPSNRISATTNSQARPRISGRIRVPIIDQIAASVSVAWLKWEATPRHRWAVMSPTSQRPTATTRPAGTRTHQRAGNWRMIQTTDHTSSPNDTPNATGLRQDTGPHQGAPSTTATSPCTAPETSSAVPHHHSSRW